MANEQTIANLIVKLSAQTVELQTGLKKAEGMISGFTSTASKLLAGISVGVIAGSLLKGVRDAQQYAASMQVLAEKTNQNIELVSALADAADDFGISADEVANALKFLARSSFEATQQTGKQREAFKALGVEYEKSPGVVRPTLDILLDLSDAFKRMDGDARRNPLAMAIMSRGFMGLIPILTQGREALIGFMNSAKESGKVIDAYTGKAARQFNVDISNLKDNVVGLAVLVMGDLLPAVNKAMKATLEWSSSLKELKEPISILVDAIKVLALMAIPLLAYRLVTLVAAFKVVEQAITSVAFARAIGGFSTLGLAVKNVGFILKAFAVSTIPLLANPFTWIAVALGGLALLWMRLSKSVEDAKVEHEKFAASLSSLDIPTLQAEIAKYQAYINTLAAYIQTKRAELDKDSTGVGASFLAGQLDKALKYMSEAEARLKLLKQAADAAMKKAEPTPEVSTQALEKVIAKTKEYESALLGLRSPALQAKAALQAFDDEIRRTYSEAPAVVDALGKMWTAFNRLQKATEKKAFGEAVNKEALSESVRDVEEAMQTLEIDYNAGLVSLDDYYSRRMILIQRQTSAEIRYLESTKLPDMEPSQIKSIDTAIGEKKAAGERKVTDEKIRQTEVQRRLNIEQREGDVSAIIDRNSAAIAELTFRYEDGLVSVREFYAEKRRLAEESSGAEVEKAQIELATAKPEDVVAAQNKINALRRKGTADKVAMDREEVMSSRASLAAQIQLRVNTLELLAQGQTDSLAAMELQGQAEVSALQQRDLEEIAMLNAQLQEKSDLEMSFQEKRQAMEDLYAAQDMRRAKMVADNERSLQLARLSMAGQVAGGLENLFGQLYEMSGKKIKAFFYLQKAASIANAVINTAEGVTKALAQGGIFGSVMAGIIMATGAAQIAVIMGQTIKGGGMRAGGPVTQGGGTEDDVPAMLMKGEYVIPRRSVEHYGLNTMEAIRRMMLPKSAFANLPRFPVMVPQFAFASGGSVTGGVNQVTVPVNVYGADKAFGSKLRANIEEVVVKTLKEYSR